MRRDQRYRAGLAAFAARDQRTAIVELRAAIAVAAQSCRVSRGARLAAAGRQTEVRARVDAFDEALRLNPYEALGNYGKGMIAYRVKDWGAAEGYFFKALAAAPKRAEAQYYMGMVKHRLGRNDEALDWMRAAATAFAVKNDQREKHCRAWIREFDKLQTR